ncbi:hypothetical protein pb186bvf_011811 [Paramecium bursaria]
MKVCDYLKQYTSKPRYDFSEYKEILEQINKRTLSNTSKINRNRTMNSLYTQSPTKNNYQNIAQNRKNLLERSKSKSKYDSRVKTEPSWSDFISDQQKQLLNEPLIYVDLTVTKNVKETITLYKNSNINKIVQQIKIKYKLERDKSKQLENLLSDVYEQALHEQKLQ